MSDEYITPALLQGVIAIAKAAGDATLPYYRQEKRLIKQHKIDTTVVTTADYAADEIVREGLFDLDHTLPILTEETANHFSWQERQQWSAYWLVDPLDGTRGFVDGDPYYTVNIALIVDHRPVLGVIYTPTKDHLHYGTAGQGSFAIRVGRTAERLHAKSLNWNDIRLVTGHFHNNEKHLLEMEQEQRVRVARLNSSYKICVIAMGEQDLYAKHTNTSEWDTAAGQVILQEAGGVVVNERGEPLTYNRKESLINPSFLALGDASQLDDVLKFVF